MSSYKHLVGLQIRPKDSTLTTSYFTPPCWPPPRDFPVVRDAEGNIISRYGDSVWILTPWTGYKSSINFGDGVTRGARLSRENADLLRLLAAWWLWGPRGCRTATTLSKKFDCIKPVFVACTKAGILASELYKFPKVVADIGSRLSPSTGSHVLTMLTDLLAASEYTGFTILDEAGIVHLSSFVKERQSTQTAYIPPRIWSYQVKRLKECLDDFMQHREQVEDCYRFCLASYADSFDGGLKHSFRPKIPNRGPFTKSSSRPERLPYHGSFRLTARHFGLEDLFDRWVNTSGASGVRCLASYMSLISNVGIIYTLNFSLMRIDEASKLRTNSYSVERDSLGDDLHYLRSETSKTLSDRDAYWIVSPTVRVAIEAMSVVSRLRIEAAKFDSGVVLTKDDVENPLLRAWAYEPWAAGPRAKASVKRSVDYRAVVKAWPKLFDQKALRITSDDLEAARLITFNLDVEKFALGKVWPLAYHQLRRTGAVNMLGSGLVSDSSLQYQLKHASRAMSRYYGQNYHRLGKTFDDETRGIYLKEMYQMIVREFSELRSDRHVSPHGQKRKDQLLSPITAKDHLRLLKDAKEGRISYRENFLGGCAKQGVPCEFGGISNISMCMGFGSKKPCEDIFLDRSKLPKMVALHDLAVKHQETAERDSPLWSSLQAQRDSLSRAIDLLKNQA